LVANLVKAILYPGVNLHARERYTLVPSRFGAEMAEDARVLDVGCGNGMLCYQAWRRGAKVLGITIKEGERRGCSSYFNEFRKIPPVRLGFVRSTIFEFQGDPAGYDAVICTDVLEHLKDDVDAVRKMYSLLKPGGRAYLTVPNASHPYNTNFPLDMEGKGGHVRSGYTTETLRAPVETAGFQIEEMAGFGGPIRQAFNSSIKVVQERFGAAAGLPLFLLALPFLPLDPKQLQLPFGLFARCRKPLGRE